VVAQGGSGVLSEEPIGVVARPPSAMEGGGVVV